jgi:hypothetical protein
MDVMTAVLARVGLARCNPMVLSHPVALDAVDAVRVQPLFQKFQTGVVIGELGLEVSDRVPLLRRYDLGSPLSPSCHSDNLSL